jgi:hypothetical protein
MHNVTTMAGLRQVQQKKDIFDTNMLSIGIGISMVVATLSLQVGNI